MQHISPKEKAHYAITPKFCFPLTLLESFLSIALKTQIAAK